MGHISAAVAKNAKKKKSKKLKGEPENEAILEEYWKFNINN